MSLLSLLPTGAMPASAEDTTLPRIGLTLSSGGTKGIAHVGVIQVPEENGMPIDAIAGTSMGPRC